MIKSSPCSENQNRQDFSTLFFFPQNVSTENKSHIKSYGKLILLLSRRLYLRYPLYHPRIAIKEAIKMFSYFRQSVLHMCYATPTILCFISSKKNIFFCIFRDNVMEYIYVSTKLQIRKENRNKVGRVPRNVGRYEESVNGDL